MSRNLKILKAHLNQLVNTYIFEQKAENKVCFDPEPHHFITTVITQRDMRWCDGKSLGHAFKTCQM